MFKPRDKASFTLGIFEGPSGLCGALVRHDTNGPALIRLFGSSLPADERLELLQEQGVSADGFGFADSYGDNPASTVGSESAELAFGGDGSAAPTDVFLSSEFGQIRVPITSEETRPGAGMRKQDLKRMLAACREAGADNIELVWCLGSDHYAWVEKTDKEAAAVQRTLRTAEGGTAKTVDHNRAVVLPMVSTREGASRILVTTPLKNEPSSEAIQILRNADESILKRCVTDTEVASLYALALTADDGDEGAGPDDPSVVVRIGDEDVLVLVMRGRQLAQVELLRSLSRHDGADVICSRVLLLQDEFGLTNSGRCLVAGDDRFVEAFRSYFGQMHVFSLGKEIARISDAEEAIYPDALRALGAALRPVLRLNPHENLLPLPLRTPRRTLPYSWEVLPLLIVLAATAVFFVGRFIVQEREIASRQDRIEATSPDTQTAAMLQQRIDSLQVAYSINMQGLEMLDSLLIGSDKWSRTFDMLSQDMADIGDIWIEKWQPAGPIVIIAGHAASRDRVVALARRLNGTVEEISYPNEEDVRYGFRLNVPIVNSLPEAARYLRDRAAEAERGPVSDPAATSNGHVTTPELAP